LRSAQRQMLAFSEVRNQAVHRRIGLGIGAGEDEVLKRHLYNGAVEINAVSEGQLLQNTADLTLDFLRWCSNQPWDWLMGLPFSRESGGFDDPRLKVWAWLREIETADATRFFRWVKLVPREFRRLTEGCYVLVGGLGSGEWWYWTRRWTAMNDDVEVRPWTEWRATEHRRLGPVLENLFRKDQFVDVDARLGSTAYWPNRMLEVDESGMPYDPLMRKALTRVKKPKARPEKTLEPVKWRDVLEDF
jgi:hypothetical protein